jgi:uncharacterized protein (DUF2164 family)
MQKMEFDKIKFASEVRDLLEAELSYSAGNMEVIPFAEKIYKLVRSHAYNEGVRDALLLVERKVSDITEQIEFLMQ